MTHTRLESGADAREQRTETKNEERYTYSLAGTVRVRARAVPRWRCARAPLRGNDPQAPNSMQVRCCTSL